MAAAASDTPQAAISDCNAHGQLTAHYSSATLQAALGQMPVDVREYTDCYDVIERQLLAQQGQATGGTATTAPASSSGSFLPTWLIIVIVLLALAAVTFGALAIRRRNEATTGADGGPGPAAGGSAPGGPGPSGQGAPPPPPEPDAPDAPTQAMEGGEPGEGEPPATSP
jgi:hypothetical protein